MERRWAKVDVAVFFYSFQKSIFILSEPFLCSCFFLSFQRICDWFSKSGYETNNKNKAFSKFHFSKKKVNKIEQTKQISSKCERCWLMQKYEIRVEKFKADVYHMRKHTNTQSTLRYTKHKKIPTIDKNKIKSNFSSKTYTYILMPTTSTDIRWQMMSKVSSATATQRLRSMEK